MKVTLMTAVVLMAIVADGKASTIVELPMLPAPTGYSAAPSPAHINAGGDVVGTVYFTRKPCPRCPTQSVTRSFLVSNGAVSQVGPDGFVIRTSNDAGTIVGTKYDIATGQTYSYEVQDGIFALLDSVPRSVVDLTEAGTVSYYPYLNDSGVMAAMLSDLEHALHAYKYDAAATFDDMSCFATSPDYECMTGGSTGFDAIHDLNNGSTVSEAMAVGEDRDNPWSSSYGRQSAFVGYRGQTTYLSTGFTAAALAVNDLGEIVGYDNGTAVIWQPTGPGTWTEVTVASLVDDPSWTFTNARSVNNAGVVVGTGKHNGIPAAYALYPEALDVAPISASGLRLTAFPNPARGSVRLRAESPADSHIAVLDLAGRLVTSFAVPRGTFEVTWNGLDADGTPVRPGVYFARLAVSGTAAGATILMLR